jgi:hypothetical protein
MNEDKRRPGRPVKPAVAGGKRPTVSLMVTAEIKNRLDAAARANGRTQSQEAEVRLEQSFRSQDLLPQVLDLAYSRPDAGFLMLLGEFLRWLAPFAADWMREPWTFQQFEDGIRLALGTLRPDGEIRPPEMFADHVTEQFGARTMREMLQALALGPGHFEADTAPALALALRAEEAIRRFAPEVVERVGQRLGREPPVASPKDNVQ